MTDARDAAEQLQPWVRAQVVDFRKSHAPTEGRYLVDTNVLYFIHYDRFGNLEELEEAPRGYQLQDYPRYLKRLREQKVQLFVHRIGLIEFARTVEWAELKILYAILTPGVLEIPADLGVKTLKRAHRDEYRVCQDRVLTYVGAVRKAYQVVGMAIQDEPDFWRQWEQTWQGTIADAPDIAQVVDMLALGIPAVISDDSDLVSIEGIRLFTANPVTIQAARLAGRLER